MFHCSRLTLATTTRALANKTQQNQAELNQSSPNQATSSANSRAAAQNSRTLALEAQTSASRVAWFARSHFKLQYPIICAQTSSIRRKLSRRHEQQRRAKQSAATIAARLNSINWPANQRAASELARRARNCQDASSNGKWQVAKHQDSKSLTNKRSDGHSSHVFVAIDHRQYDGLVLMI